MNWQQILIENTWKSAVVLGGAWSAALLLRRSSAAVRHFVWTGAFAALLLLPAALLAVHASTTLPAVFVEVPVGPLAPVPARHAVVAAPAFPWTALVWAIGCAAAAARFLLGALRTSWMARRGTEARHVLSEAEGIIRMLGIRRPVRIVESADAPAPMAWGMARPVVVLPLGSEGWPAGRLRAVLLHELTHVRRYDLVAQAVAQAACCLFWFQPLAWLAFRRLRKERELACDDAVLLRGLAAHDYASHLTEMARGLASARRRWIDAPAMAEMSDLESRVRAMLDGARRRQPLSRSVALSLSALAMVVLLPIAVITARAQAARSVLAGVVFDPSGARVPNCRITARGLDSNSQEVTVANEAGEYRFASIPAGRYTIEVESRGFARTGLNVELTPGNVNTVDLRLRIGEIMETVRVTGPKSGTPSPRSSAPQRVRIGGMLTVPRVILNPPPVYPTDLQLQGVEGSVVVKAIVSKTGEILSTKVVNTVDPGLAQAAMDAVKQWRYEPGLLNGEPVEMLTTITVDFTLKQ